MIPAAILLASALPLAGLDAAAVMTNAAANMERAVDARRQYVYDQKVRAKLIRSDGKLSREEKRAYSAAPGESRTEKKLVSLEGAYRDSKSGKMVAYDQPRVKHKGMDIDAELIDDLIGSLVDSKKSRDGIPASLFPLRAADLPGYRFHLVETIELGGRPTHRIAFEPVRKSFCVAIGDDQEGACEGKQAWKGEALIDAEDQLPAGIQTQLAFKMPWAVKAFLGTNLRQSGFSVSYERVAPGVWFPRSYGTEFRLDVLFGYKRVITLSMDSANFQRTSAESTIEFKPVE